MTVTSEPRHRRWRQRTLATAATGLAALIVGGGAALAAIPGTASGSAVRASQANQTPSQQVTALQSQLKALQSQLKSLQKRLSDIESYDNCLSVTSVRAWGDGPQGNYGYSWHTADGGQYNTTALDYVDEDDFDAGDGDQWFAVVDPSCVTAGRIALVHAPAK